MTDQNMSVFRITLALNLTAEQVREKLVSLGVTLHLDEAVQSYNKTTGVVAYLKAFDH